MANLHVTYVCLPSLSKKKLFPGSSQGQGLFFQSLWAVVMGNHAESWNHRATEPQAGPIWEGIEHSSHPTSLLKRGLPRVHCTGFWLDGS